MVLSFDHLSAEQFEEFCYDLLDSLGFIHLDWRKGSMHGVTSPDKGRDLHAELQKDDAGTPYSEKWFVECKRHKETVSIQAFDNILRWAQADRADVALIIVSGFISIPAKEYLETYKAENRPPFRIRVWEAKDIEQRLGKHLGVARKYALDVSSKEPLTLAEIRVQKLPGKERWYAYQSISDGEVKVPVMDYLAKAAGLTLNDELPVQPIRLEPTFYELKAVEPEDDGSFVRMRMISCTAKRLLKLGDVIEIAGIKMEAVAYHGESKEFGVNSR